jgi:hypothetical protein
VDLHFLEESSRDGDSLLVLLNQPMRGKGGKQAQKRPKVDKTFETQEEKINQKEANKTPRNFWPSLIPFKLLWCSETKQHRRTMRLRGSWTKFWKASLEWGLGQGGHQGKIVELFHREGDQNEKNVTLVTPG